MAQGGIIVLIDHACKSSGLFALSTVVDFRRSRARRRGRAMSLANLRQSSSIPSIRRPLPVCAALRDTVEHLHIAVFERPPSPRVQDVDEDIERSGRVPPPLVNARASGNRPLGSCRVAH